MNDQHKKLRKRAAKIRSRQRRAGEEPAPIDVWVRRLEDGGAKTGIDGFQCRNCGHKVGWDGAGTMHRNHCPNCLSSLHLDHSPGDRAAECGGVMEPVAVWVRKGGEWAIVHRCRLCGALSSNRVAADDNAYALLSIAIRPLANPPFPLDRLELVSP